MADRKRKTFTTSTAEEFLDTWPNTGLSPQENINNIEDIIDSLSSNQLMSIGYTREAILVWIDKEVEKVPQGMQISIPYGGYFEGYEIKIIRGATGRKERFEFLYGGKGRPDGEGHGHVVCNDGCNVIYWKKPDCEGGDVIINDKK